MPAPNASRRRALADAALELIAGQGLHGLTHRALDRAAGVPAGTSSNYFPTRDALLLAAAERVMELHQQDMETITESHPRAAGRPTLSDAAELIAQSLLVAATTHRTRYLAVFELQAEIRRRPELRDTLGRMLAASAGNTAEYHRRHGLPIPPEAVPALQALFGGALLALLHVEPDGLGIDQVRPLAQAMIYGVRSGRPRI